MKVDAIVQLIGNEMESVSGGGICECTLKDGRTVTFEVSNQPGHQRASCNNECCYERAGDFFRHNGGMQGPCYSQKIYYTRAEVRRLLAAAATTA